MVIDASRPVLADRMVQPTSRCTSSWPAAKLCGVNALISTLPARSVKKLATPSRPARPQLVALSTRVFTGWLDVSSDGTVVYAPHTSKGFVAPPRKKLLLVSNGLFAKYGTWQARRQGTTERLKRLAADTVRP
jgi:hypothetical protein